MVCFLIENGKVLRTLVQVGRSDGRFVEVLKRQSPNSTLAWEEFTGNEKIADRPAGLSNDQTVQQDSAGK
jgi:hypothetical protein